MKRKADEAEIKNISHNTIKLMIHESLGTCTEHFSLVTVCSVPRVTQQRLGC